MSRPEPDGRGFPTAEEAYAEFLRLRDLDKALDFEAFCRRYPPLADGLRLLHMLADESSTGPGGRGEEGTVSLPLEPLLPEGRGAEPLRTARLGPHPEHIGPYRILEVLGEGGMGVVYLAEQREPIRRRVALKIIKLGMDTREVVARFESERQALALMNHPHIARIIDAGSTAEGRPFFVMEHVPGEPITRYCDRNRLSIRERIDLFLPVCEAVQHAHQKAIIHRDLKPSNVLVMVEDGKPVAKVIDFGVAKAVNQRLTEKTVFTEQGQIIGTPEYMSPEQAEMGALDIDTRTDIYSLGILLYELLVGALPFDAGYLRQKGYGEIQRIIREVEPPRPSTRLSGLGKETTALAEKRRTEPGPHLRQLRGDLDWITMKAMEKDRTRRYSTASEFAADLQRHLEHEPVLAGPPGAAYRLQKLLRRQKGRLAVALLAALLMIASALTLHRHLRDTGASKTLRYRNLVLEAVTKIELGRPPTPSRSIQMVKAEEPPDGVDQESVTLPETIALEDPVLDPVEEAPRLLEQAAEISPEKPEAYYHQARSLRVLGEKVRAEEALALALRCDSHFVPALVLQAALLKERGDKEGAQAALLKAGNTGSSEWVQAWLNADRARASRRWKEAEEAYGELLRLEARGMESYIGFSISTRLSRGRARLEARDFDGALEDFSIARGLWPQLLQPVLLLGRTYLLKGELSQAEKRFEEFHAEAVRPDEVALGIANVYGSLERYDLGLPWLDRAFSSPALEAKKVLFLRHLGRLDEVIDRTRKAIRLQPGDVQTRCALAEALMAQRRFPEAEVELRQAIQIESQNTRAPNLLASVLLQQKKRADAVAELKKAIGLNPRNGAAYLSLGNIIVSDWRFEEGIAFLNQAVAIDSNDSTVRGYLGNALLWQDRLLEALAEYRRAIELGTRLVQSHEAVVSILHAREVTNLGSEIPPLIVALEERLSSEGWLGSLLSRPAGSSAAAMDRSAPEGDTPVALLKALALALARESPARNPARAEGIARLVLEKSKAPITEALEFLSDVRFLSGNTAGAVSALEEAQNFPGVNPHQQILLEGYRRALLPDIPTFASIDAALELPDQEVLVPAGAEWRFRPGTVEPSAGLQWTVDDFPDHEWERGPSGFGFGRPRHDGQMTFLAVMAQSSTIYLRGGFEVSDPSSFRRLRLLVYAKDGFVGYLNGREVGRANAGKSGTPLAFNGKATGGSSGDVPFEVVIEAERLVPGRNCLAIMGIKRRAGMPFFLLPVLNGERRLVPGRPRALLAGLRTAAKGTDAVARVAYLESRVLRDEGNRAGATSRLQDVRPSDRSDPESLLRVVERFRALGDWPSCEIWLRKAFEEGWGDWEKGLYLWLSIFAGELKRSPRDLLSWLAGVRAAPSDRWQWVRWSLEVLSDRQVTQIPREVLAGDPSSTSDRLYSFAVLYGYPRLWESLRRSVSSRRVLRSLTQGGYGGASFEEVPQPGSLLTGLEINFAFGRQKVVRAVQPIFLCEEGKLVGRLLGGGRTPDSVRIEGRPGYSVGGLLVSAEERITGLKVIFMKIREGGLDPGDSYESSWLGSAPIGVPTKLCGLGLPVVGLHGRSGADVDCLGLVSLEASLSGHDSIDDQISDRRSIVPEQATWAYFLGVSEPPAEWNQPIFDDSAWKRGPSGFGYRYRGTRTRLPDMRGACSTLYLRKMFLFSEPARFREVLLDVQADDGFVAYLDGKEIGRMGAGGQAGRASWTSTAEGAVSEPIIRAEIPIEATRLTPGFHCLGILGLNASKDDVDFFLLPILRGRELHDSGDQRSLLEEAGRSSLAGDLRAYLEGRILQQGGDHRRAVGKFEAASLLNGNHAAPFFRRFQCLSAIGDQVAQEACLLQSMRVQTWPPLKLPNPAFLGAGGPMGKGVQGFAPDLWNAFGLEGSELQVEAVPIAEGELFLGSPPTRAVLLKVKKFGRDQGLQNDEHPFPMDPGVEYVAEFYFKSGNPGGSSQHFDFGFELLQENKGIGRSPGSRANLQAGDKWQRFVGPPFRDGQANRGVFSWRCRKDQAENAILIALPGVMAIPDLEDSLRRGPMDLAAQPDRPFDPWGEWFAINLLDRKRPADQALSSLPPDLRDAPGLGGEDLVWVLESLVQRHAVRLNCGGGDYQSRSGVRWGHDRFFRSGHPYFGDGRGAATAPFTGEITGTDDDPLYQTERWFPRGDAVPAAYRIPLPPGDYKVTLHFAEILFQTNLADFLNNTVKRRFEVFIEGRRVLTNYAPAGGAFALADQRVFDVQVSDGLLDLEFGPVSADPKVSAMEIEPVH